MIRRRRPQREIPFSFDSFLDVVANVVGIIIRLILVVWVGARSYSNAIAHLKPPSWAARAAPKASAVSHAPLKATTASMSKPPSIADDPLQDEITRNRAELATLQARLLEQLGQLRQVRGGQEETEHELLATEAAVRKQAGTTADLGNVLRRQQALAHQETLSLEELKRHSNRLRDEIRALEKLPRLRQRLHYHTPVSQPVDAEEVMFECRRGRVTYVDVPTLIAEVKRDLQDQAKTLQTRWQVEGVAGPVGAFRLRYVIERQRGLFDSLCGDAPAAGSGSYQYGLSEWQLEAVADNRGETEAAALDERSAFRQVVDTLDPKLTVVTMWVYPDSFALYRRLRDYLYDRDLIVAGRPLPEGVSISCSRSGSVSRGQ